MLSDILLRSRFLAASLQQAPSLAVRDLRIGA